MKPRVLVVGSTPTLFLAGDQAVVRVEAPNVRAIELRNVKPVGYATNIGAAELAAYLLKYATGATGFQKHHCPPTLVKTLRAIAKDKAAKSA